MVRIWIHSNIARLVEGKMDWEANFSQEQTSVGEILKTVFAEHKILLFGIIDETDSVRQHINVYIGSKDIKKLDGLESIVKQGDEINIFTAVSGG